MKKQLKNYLNEEKNQYHIENMVQLKLVLVDKKKIPKTNKELKDWVINKSKEKNYLVIN